MAAAAAAMVIVIRLMVIFTVGIAVFVMAVISGYKSVRDVESPD